jgi:hypothetical protein
MRAYVTIDNAGRLVCEPHRDAQPVVITSAEQLEALCPDGFLASSSVDFPDEYTADPVVIEICRSFR